MLGGGNRPELLRRTGDAGACFEYNRGALVEAVHGKGEWVYIGLGLWRQLPAGIPGAYRLLANLLSLPRASAGH